MIDPQLDKAKTKAKQKKPTAKQQSHLSSKAKAAIIQGALRIKAKYTKPAKAKPTNQGSLL